GVSKPFCSLRKTPSVERRQCSRWPPDDSAAREAAWTAGIFRVAMRHDETWRLGNEQDLHDVSLPVEAHAVAVDGDRFQPAVVDGLRRGGPRAPGRYGACTDTA